MGDRAAESRDKSIPDLNKISTSNISIGYDDKYHIEALTYHAFKHEPQQREDKEKDTCRVTQTIRDLHYLWIIYISKMEGGSENYKALYISLKAQYESLASDR